MTLRVRKGFASLRTRTFVRLLSASFRQACERGNARLVPFSIQRDHLHLILEAEGKQALGTAMKSIAARVARCVNRVFRRAGPVLLGRYHVRALRTPRERGAGPPVQIDEASSGAWFNGWSVPLQPLSSREPPPVASPRTWLLRVGWQRHGLIEPVEVPGRK